MLYFKPHLLPPLLCLLVACAPDPAPLSDGQPQLQDETAQQRLASPLEAGTWNPTGYLLRARAGHTATLLPNGKVLVVGGISGGSMLASAEVYDPVTGAWSLTGSLGLAREGHTATLLPAGKVLVVGGKQGTAALSSAEVYDPATGTWSPTNSLIQARQGHTATLLPAGKVLVVGGKQDTAALASAEVYDPATGTWSSTSSLIQAREHHTTTLLPGGKALVVGGTQGSAPLASAELYDAATETWSPAGVLSQAREHHTATLLPGGKLLVVGGQGTDGVYLASAEEYDTATGTWSSSGPGPMTQVRARHSAALVPGGKLLVVGGFREDAGSSGPVGATELYDPKTKTWSSSGWMERSRFDLTATLLPGGEILVVGGKTWDHPGIIAAVVAEVYAPPSGSWTPAGALSQGRRDHTASLLPDGKVLVVGGTDRYAGTFASVDVYDPLTGAWTSARSLGQSRGDHTATLLPEGKVLVVGGHNGYGALTSAELYDPSTGIWSPTGSLKQARLEHTATLLPDGKVLVVGGYDERGSLASAEVYDPDTGTWSSTGSLKQIRARHAAILLQNGKVLVLGGEEALEIPLSSAEVYNPVTGSWSTARPIKRPRRLFTTTLLPDGNLLVVGGEDGSGTILSSTETYSPDTGSSVVGSLNEGRLLHTATLLPDGKVLVAGGSASLFSPPPVAEVYDPATETWSTAGSPAQARESHTATLLPGGRVLVVGGVAPFGSGTGEISSTELFVKLPMGEMQPPRITDVRPTQSEYDPTFTVLGEHFRGSFEASSGNTQSSPTNHPMLSLNSIESGGWVPLHGHDVSDTSILATIPSIPPGYYLLNVTTQGLSSSRMVLITRDNQPKPHTSLDFASPASVTQSTAATFLFSSATTSSFVCDLDGILISACSGPQNYSALLEGEHTFQVRARALNGNEDPTPEIFHWVIDKTGPETKIHMASAPRKVTPDRIARFSFSSSEEGSSFECSLDGEPFTACSNVKDYSGLPDGEHTFQVRATDKVGNLDPSAAEYHWVITRGSHYDMGCSATPTAFFPWPWVVLLLRLLQRRPMKGMETR